jgi:DNA polymerase III delta prime subunit
MTQLSKLLKPKAHHVLVYGPPKTGKTLLIGQLAEAGYFIDYFDLENGSVTLFAGLSDEAKERVNLIRIPDTKEWPIAIETCLKVVAFVKRPIRICDTHGKIDCAVCVRDAGVFSVVDFSTYTDKHIFVTDSITQLSNSAMNQINKRMNKGVADDEWTPEWEHFREQGTLLDRFLGNIQNAPYHCICATHEIAINVEADKNKKTGGKEKIYPIAGTRNFSRNMAKYFDEVIYTRIYNARHQAVSKSTAMPDILTGSRTDLVLEKLDQPSLLGIFDGSQAAPTLKEQAKTLLTTGVIKP